MQIHELNKKPTKINEADLVGPNSVFNVGKELGKQLIKDPRGVTDPASIGIAKQNAAAASAAGSAADLAKKGYRVGGSAKEKTTPQQQLAQVQTNPAVQQMVKNLAAQWKTQGVAVAGKIKTTKMNETATPIDPKTIKDPDELKLLNLFYKQQGLEMPQSQVAAPPDVQSKANQKLNAFATEFQNWASPKLQAIGVNLGVVMQDPWASKTIQQILTQLSVESLANPESTATTGLVEQFFNIAIATSQAKQQSPTSGKAPLLAQGSSAENQSDQEIIAQSGAAITKAQIESLGAAMRKSANGSTVIRDTGNGLLNAIARMAGFRIGQ